MHLKSLELVGFKSFADRTVIELKEGISGIVGPNGCGKSNVVDAVRWCLGEMSARTLRSKQMLDVIFAGAAGRPASNMSEVTLTFDNTSHLLPMDFTEIQVTRRLFRSGESQYFLNRVQCRLKDIRDLFLDTGLGEGYSILAQGEVDFVINAKPEERRELFEEAAGISKYKVRREEAVRKLDRVELDISRLNDILTVVKEQMTSLESAVKKANLYQKLKEELKSLEITDSVVQIRAIDGQTQTIQAALNELQLTVQQATSALDQSDADLTTNRVRQDECDADLIKQRTAILDLDRAANAADHAVKLGHETEQQLIQQEKRCREQIAAAEESLASLKGRLESAEKEIEGARASVGQLNASAEGEKAIWKESEKARKDMESSRDEISKTLFEAASEISRLQNEKNSRISLQIHKQSDIQSAQKELEKSSGERSRLEQEIAELKQNLESFGANTSGTAEEIRAAREALALAESKLADLSEKIRASHRVVIQNETQIEALDKNFETNPYRKGTQAVLKQGFPGLRGVVGILLKYPEHAGQWVESALGHRLNWLVFDRLENAQNALQWLKNENLGRASCIVLEKIPASQPLDIHLIPNANSLLQFVQCDADLENLKNFLLGSAFVAGSALYDGGMIDGGSDVPSSSKDAASAQNQFLVKDTLASEIAAKRSDLEKFEQELSQTQGEISNLKALLAEKEMSLEKARMQEAHLRQVLAVKQEESGLCSREMAMLEERSAKDGETLKDLESEMTAIQQNIDGLVLEQKKKEEDRQSFEARVREKREEEHRNEVQFRNTEIRLEMSRRELERSEGSLNEMRSSIQQYGKMIEETTLEIESCKVRIVESQQTQQEAASKIQSLEAEKKGLAEQIEVLIQKKTGLDGESHALQAKVQELRQKQNELSAQSHQYDIDLRTLENESKNIARRLEENYQLTIEQAREMATQLIVEAEQIQRLRKRVESMANSVNLEAPEQFKQLEERFSFLNSQTEDLVKARDDLRNAIKQINTTTREQFKETFEKVRENFKQVYATLFEGGSADLVFTDDLNIFETGIDILAQPPGKKCQSISLLSGGEKALTAISLLFSFFLVKPSPFCIMDEVDAPWDPANINRFLKLLKEFSKKTQFLVVTHSPLTMETAEVLYGVTMEEFGVSKIISAKLRTRSIAAPQETLSQSN